MKMVGTVQKKSLKLGAAETWGMMLFIVDTMSHYRLRLSHEGMTLLTAGESLIRFHDMLRTNGPNLSDAAVGESMGALYLRFYKGLGDYPKPLKLFARLPPLSVT